MWMLQLQRVGVSRLRRRDQEGGRGKEREREMAGLGVWGHTPLQHTRVHAPVYAPTRSRLFPERRARPSVGAGQRGGEGKGRETERREISSSKTSRARASRDSRYTWVLLTHLYTPRHFHRYANSPPLRIFLQPLPPPR